MGVVRIYLNATRALILRGNIGLEFARKAELSVTNEKVKIGVKKNIFFGVTAGGSASVEFGDFREQRKKRKGD